MLLPEGVATIATAAAGDRSVCDDDVRSIVASVDVRAGAEGGGRRVGDCTDRDAEVANTAGGALRNIAEIGSALGASGATAPVERRGRNGGNAG